MMSQIEKSVFDRVHFDAFIKIALEEKLLFFDKKKYDNFNPFEEVIVTPEKKDIVLEQLVLTPQILTTDTLFSNNASHGALSGELIDKGTIQYVEKLQFEEDRATASRNFVTGNRTDDIVSKIMAVPLPAVLGLINSNRKTKLTGTDVRNLLATLITAQKEQYEFEVRTGKKPPNLSPLARMFEGKLNELGIEVATLEDQYTKDEIDAQKVRNSIYTSTNPILGVFNDFHDLTGLASRENALVKFALPKDFSISDVENDSTDSNKKVALFRFVAGELSTTTHRNTMKRTLKLTDEKASEALRYYISQLVQEVENFNEAEIDRIRKEIGNALAKLDGRRILYEDALHWGTIAFSISVLNVMAQFAGVNTLIPGTVITIGGLTLTYVGGMYQRKIAKSVEKRYRWAHFNTRM